MPSDGELWRGGIGRSIVFREKFFKRIVFSESGAFVRLTVGIVTLRLFWLLHRLSEKIAKIDADFRLGENRNTAFGAIKHERRMQ